MDAYYAGISSDADVMRYLPGGKPRLRSDSQWVISYFMHHAELHGFGVWAVEEKASGALIGHAGLEHIPGAQEVEIAYTLAKAYWGRGFATEAAGASLSYGFEALNLAGDLRAGVPAEHGVAERHAQAGHGRSGRDRSLSTARTGVLPHDTEEYLRKQRLQDRP